MVRKREEIEELIALYLSGEASPEQAMDLDDWRSQHTENQALFDTYEKTYNSTNSTVGFKSPDVQAAWNKVKGSIKEETKIIPLIKNKKFYLSIAAVAMIAFVIGSLWNFNPEGEVTPTGKVETVDTLDVDVERVIYASNHVESVTLKDLSVVELEPGSKLTLAKDFNKNGRHAELEGSGRFTVVHDESNPFILQVEGLEVFDVGTVFDIETRGDTIRVVVSEGAVELRLNGETLALAEGDSAYYVISDQLMERYKKPKQRLDKVFEFDGVTLEQILHDIGEFFGRKIVIKDNEMKNCRLTLTFKDETLAEIFEIIKLTIDIEIVHNNQTIEVYGEGCL